MTDLVIALSVVSGAVVGLFLFGSYWIRVERRQASERDSIGPSTLMEQQSIPFPERELATMGRDR
jgi:hypothetical protein